MTENPKLLGCYVVSTTPFTKSDRVDEDAIRQNIEWYLRKGIQGIVATGSTGEFTKLSDDERKTVYKTVIEQVNGRVPVMFGTAADSTKDTVRWTSYAKDNGANGVMIVPPYYCLPGAEEIFQHFKAVSDAVELPIILYNNPPASGVDMMPDLVKRLSKLKNVKYIKEDSGDSKRTHEIMRICDADDIKIICGYDDVVLECFVLGVRGLILATANVIPGLFRELFDYAVVELDYQKAADQYYKMLPFLTWVERSESNFTSVLKTGMDMIGKGSSDGPIGGSLRGPCLPLPKHDRETLEKILADMGVI